MHLDISAAPDGMTRVTSSRTSFLLRPDTMSSALLHITS